MAAKNPAVKGETGFYPHRTTVLGGALASTAVLSASGVAHKIQGLEFFQAYFADIDDGDTWDDPPPGVVAVAWQGDDLDADFALCHVVAQGQIRFDTNAQSNLSGWVWGWAKRGGS